MRGFGDIAEHLRRATAHVISGDRSSGSAIVWTADGLLVTSAHVVRPAATRIELWDGRTLDARIVGWHSLRDLAALRIQTEGLEPARPGDSDSVRPGELVVAVGNPLGFIGAVSTGVVHSFGPVPGMGRQRWICANVRLAPGNSGGLLANAQGQVVGINTAIVNGLGVAVPVSAALDFLRRGAPPSLGVTLRQLQYGLLIPEVEPGGAAANSSLQAGDVLLSSLDDLSANLDSGQEVLRLRFLRGSSRRVREAFVRLAARAEASES